MQLTELPVVKVSGKQYNHKTQKKEERLLARWMRDKNNHLYCRWVREEEII